MATQISDFTAAERQTLTVLAIAVDEIPSERRDAAMRLITALRDVTLDEEVTTVIGPAIERLCGEDRLPELLEYFCADRPLMAIQSEIFHAAGAD